MTCVNVHVYALTDKRFARLASLLGLADGDHARGKVEHLWMACTLRGETELPQWLVEEHLGERGADALVESELARWARGRGDSKTRRLYIRGALGRTEWYQRNGEQSSKGGKARAAKASRVAGKFTSEVAGDITSAKSESVSESESEAKELREKNSAPPSAGGAPLELESPKPGKKRKARPSDPTESELASVRVVLEKLSARNGVAYSGSAEHTRLIVGRLREGYTEMDLRVVIGYCADELGWKGDQAMEKFLRPETLFGPKTIAKYADPARAWFAKLPPDEPPQHYHDDAEAEPDWMRGGEA